MRQTMDLRVVVFDDGSGHLIEQRWEASNGSSEWRAVPVVRVAGSRSFDGWREDLIRQLVENLNSPGDVQSRTLEALQLSAECALCGHSLEHHHHAHDWCPEINAEGEQVGWSQSQAFTRILHS